MSLWNTLVQKLKGIIGKMIGAKAIERELQVTYAISPQMETAIQTWSNLYRDKADWLHEPDIDNPVRVVSLGLPAMIASEKARTALLEFESEITTPKKEFAVADQSDPEENLFVGADREPITEERPIGDTQRAEYLEKQYKKLKAQLRKQIEYGIAKGGLVIKPYIVVKNNDNKGENDVVSDIVPTTDIEFDFIQADSFYPLAFDASGKITEAAFIQSKVDKAVIYRRLEYHKWEDNVVTIVNKAYKSASKAGLDVANTDLGDEIPLTDVPEWKNFEKEIKIKNVERPLFAYFKMPEANTIDTLSPLGVSGFSRAVSLIKDADMQYSRLLWEYEAGEMAVNIDRDAFKFIDDPMNENGGHTSLGAMQDRLYRKVDVSADELFQPYAPMLRDEKYIAGLNTILMRIEDVCAISRGTLSDSADIARTATELKILKQRSYQANVEIQQAIEMALRDVIYVMNVYCTLYNITPDGPYDVSFEWDDSLIVDTYEELNARLALMGEGLVSKVENRMWYFGETKRQAKEALAEVEQETMRAMEQELVVQANNLGQDDDVSRQNRSSQQKLNQRGMTNEGREWKQ